MKNAIIRGVKAMTLFLAALVELRATYRASLNELAPVPVRIPEGQGRRRR